MFNVITPKKRSEFIDDLEQMFKKLAIEYNDSGKDAFDHERALYIVCSHKKFGVIGGARLIPMEAPCLTRDFLKRLKFDPRQKSYEISRVYFQIADKDPDSTQQKFELIARDFYQGLYEALKTISIAQKIKLFVSAIPMDEHQNIQQLGLWPFEKQAKMASPYKDGVPYVLGFMPMSDHLYEHFLMRKATNEQSWLKAI